MDLGCVSLTNVEVGASSQFSRAMLKLPSLTEAIGELDDKDDA